MTTSPGRGDRTSERDAHFCRPFRASIDGKPIRGLRCACPRLFSEAPPASGVCRSCLMMYLAGRRTDFDPQSHVWATVRAEPGDLPTDWDSVRMRAAIHHGPGGVLIPSNCGGCAESLFRIHGLANGAYTAGQKRLNVRRREK